jgi:4-amino-4-deoxy-L-arabinose transferase-like glycosyltransferase
MTRVGGVPVRVGAILAVVLLGAAALRFAALSSLPPAHYRDVAITANDALRALAGHARVHYVRDEGLYANLMAVVFALAGPSDAAVRFPGALFGTLTCLALYALGRALGSARAGLYGALFLAVSLWHVILSRSGFRAILLPLLLAGGLALLVEGLERTSTARCVAAGALVGLCAHAYTSSRLVPLLLPFAAAVALGLDAARWRRARRGLAAFALAAAAIAAPMAWHYLKHPEHFTDPKRVVSVFSPNLPQGTLLPSLGHGILATALMLHVHGDENWRHNIAGSPMLDPLTGLLLIVGIVAAVRAACGAGGGDGPFGRRAAVLLLAWVPIMLLPSALSVEGVPHALRSCGALPALMLLAGAGAVLAEDAVARRFGARAAAVIAITLGFGLAGATAYRYFVVWGGDPEVFAAHDGAYRAAARALLAAPPGVDRFLVANGRGFDIHGSPAEVHTFLFEMRGHEPVLLGPKDGARLVLQGRPAIVAFVRREENTLALIQSLNPGATIRTVTGPGISPDSPVYRVN